MDFDKVYNTYYMKVFSYVMTIMKNTQLSEEVTQEVFFKALKTKKQYDGKSSEFTWLCTIAKNTCMDIFRKQSKRGRVSQDLKSDLNVEQNMIDKDMTFRIHMI